MLQPARTKYRKMKKGRMRGKAYRGSDLDHGEYGLQATECGYLTARQIEAARVAITRHVKRGGKLWIRIFPDKPITKKAAETRMGNGKGNVEYYVAVDQAGPHPLRDGGLRRRHRQEGLPPGGAQAAGLDQDRQARRDAVGEGHHGHRERAGSAEERRS